MSDIPEEPTAIDLTKALEAAQRDALIVLRSHAVNSYAILERSLCALLEFALQTTGRKAEIIFYRVVNTRSRNTIIDSLLTIDLPLENLPFWKGCLKLIKSLDQQRNEIIHWHVVANVGLNAEGATTSYLSLVPPASGLDTQQQKLDVDVLRFIEQCDFVSQQLSMFLADLIVARGLPLPEPYQQAPTYPPHLGSTPPHSGKE